MNLVPISLLLVKDLKEPVPLNNSILSTANVTKKKIFEKGV